MQAQNQDPLTASLLKLDITDNQLKPSGAQVPGSTNQTQETTLNLLEQNSLNFSIFFNDKGYHNHCVHHLLAAYAFGASSERLNRIYEKYANYLRPRLPPKVTITEENWTEYLGRADLWTEYLVFFEDIVERDGYKKAFENYGFHPSMLSLLYARAFHPIIHIGYGYEFNLPLIVAEGLAQAAVHNNLLINLINQEFLSYNEPEKKPILDIIEDISKEEFIKKTIDYNDELKQKTLMLNKDGVDLVRNHAKKWVILETEEDLKKATHELYKACVLIYGGAAIRPDNEVIRPDFFLMHALNAMFFITSILPHISSLQKRIQLLRGEFATLLTFYASQGCPKLNIEALKYYKPKTLSEEPNPWLEIIKYSLEEEAEPHVIKVVRSLMKAGELMGPEKDDLYVKIAQLSIEGYDKAGWSLGGSGWDQEWSEEGIKKALEFKTMWSNLGSKKSSFISCVFDK